jgi:hypothetical protein
MITSTVMSGIRLLMLTEEEVVTCQKSARKDGQLRDEKDDFVAQAAVAQNNSTTGCGSLRQAVDGYGEGLGTLWFGSGSPSVVQRWSGGRAMEKDWGRGLMYHKKMDECEGRISEEGWMRSSVFGCTQGTLWRCWVRRRYSMRNLGGYPQKADRGGYWLRREGGGRWWRRQKAVQSFDRCGRAGERQSWA